MEFVIQIILEHDTIAVLNLVLFIFLQFPQKVLFEVLFCDYIIAGLQWYYLYFY